jgi:hypothetical protein
MLRLVLDVFIFFARNVVLAFAAFLAVYLIASRWNGPWRRLASPSPSFWLRSTVGFCLGLTGVFVGIAGWYLFVEGYAGEVEPVVSCLSWMVYHGHELYHGFGAAERYSLLYGPAVFLTNGMFLEILGPSLVSAKLASLLGVIGSLMFLYAAVRRRSLDLSAVVVTAMAVLYYWSQGFAVYLVRPDALLLFAVGLGLFAAVRLRPWIAAAAIGAALGFAVNLKVHAAIYFVPILVLFIHRCGWRTMWVVGPGAALITAAPFLLHPGVSVSNYVVWLRNAAEHGLVFESFPATLTFSVYLLLPVVVLRIVCGPASLDRPGSRGLLVSLVPTFALILLLAAKPGAGLVHLLPLVPITLLLVGRMLQDGFRDWRLLRPTFAGHPLRQGLAASLLVTLLLSGTVNEYRAVKLLDWQVAQDPGLVADLKGIMDRFPGVSMAMACGGENASFRHTWLRPLLVFANHPVLLDPVAVMESALNGKDLSADTYAALAQGVVQMWLVPRSERPFQKMNWYEPHDPVFSARFREHFEAWYAPRSSSRYFDLWFWKGLPADGTVTAEFISAGESQIERAGP